MWLELPLLRDTPSAPGYRRRLHRQPDNAFSVDGGDNPRLRDHFSPRRGRSLRCLPRQPFSLGAQARCSDPIIACGCYPRTRESTPAVIPPASQASQIGRVRLFESFAPLMCELRFAHP
jgi:hypothetical protein